MSELRECPFCGSKDVVVCVQHNPTTATTWNFVMCKNIDCNAEGPVDLGMSGSEEKWNTRPGEDALRARVAELEARDDSDKRYHINGRGLPISDPADVGLIFLEHITDDFGNYWPKFCHCGAPMVVLSPGFARCSKECSTEG